MVIDNLEAAEILLGEEEIKQSDESNALKPEYPYSYATWKNLI